jgi:hypothetical protein
MHASDHELAARRDVEHRREQCDEVEARPTMMRNAQNSVATSGTVAQAACSICASVAAGSS